MSDSYFTLAPSYYAGLNLRDQHARVSVTLDFALDVAGTARLAIWNNLMTHLSRTGNWSPGESEAAIVAWLAKVDAQGYVPRITSDLVSVQPLEFTLMKMPERLKIAQELLVLASDFPARLRALELVDFVGGGVKTPADTVQGFWARLSQPTPWASEPGLAAAVATFARAALKAEDWPGNRGARFLAERPGLAALL